MLAQEIQLQFPPPSLVEQLAPLAVAFAALAGVLLGGFLQSRLTRTEVSRRAAQEAYGRLVVTCHLCSRSAAELYEASSDDRPHMYVPLKDAVFDLRAAVSEVELLAPDLAEQAAAIARAAIDVSDAMHTPDGIDDVRGKTSSFDQWPLIQIFEKSLAAFIDRAKKSIGG